VPRQLYRLSLCGIDHVDRAAIPRMFERKCHEALSRAIQEVEFASPSAACAQSISFARH
jgi:hypothetical protein